MKISLDCHATARFVAAPDKMLDAAQCRTAGLDGFEATDVEIAPHLDDPLLMHRGIADGGVRFWLDGKNELRATISFQSGDRLVAGAQRALIRAIEGQLLDGWGEGYTLETAVGQVAIDWFERQRGPDRKIKLTQVKDGAPAADRRVPKLMKAAEAGDVIALGKALASGVDVNARGQWSVTALMLAAREGHAACVALLLQHGADVNIVTGDGGTTALTMVAMSGHEAVMQMLIAAGASLSVGQKSPLHWAANRDHVALVRLLISAGADLALCDESGDTALYLASDPEIIRVLVEAGADLGFRNARGETPLAHALDQADGFERLKWAPGAARWRDAAEELRRLGA